MLPPSTARLYKYRPLEAEEIRLIKILPGQLEDSLQIEIHHAVLHTPYKAPTSRLRIDQLRETLPEGWQIFETIDRDYLFCNSNPRETSWDHPNSEIGRVLYAPLPDYPGDLFEPKYEALSYTWGDEMPQEKVRVMTSPPPKVSITVVDTAEEPDEHGKMEVRLNLASAMRHLRLPDRARMLWIDAICINQRDDEEKSSQVKRISQIYELASAIIAWLGHGEDNAVRGRETLSAFGDEIEHTINYFCFPTPKATHPDWFEKTTALPFDADSWIGVADLLRRAWFQRVWVWQEIQLGNRNRIIMCGRTSKPWSMVRKTILALFGHASIPHTVARLIDRRRWIANIASTLDIETIIFSAALLKCSDDHDKVYGVLNLLGPAVKELITPDYSAQVANAYKDLVLAVEQTTGTLNLIGVGSPDLTQHTGPSWTPNLAKLEQVWTGRWQVSTGVSNAEARYLDGDVLQVHGIACGTVESVFASDWISEDIAGLAVVVQMLSGCKPVAKRLRDCNIDLIDEMVRIVCDCFTKDRLPEEASVWDQQQVRGLFDAALGGGESNGLADIDLWTRLKARNEGHSLIISDNGLIGKVGAGREMVRAGDVITTLLGRNSPLLLRPVDNDAYVVIAGVMVPDLCDSVSILGPLPTPWKMRLIDQIDHPRPQPHYTNTVTNETSREDPRLGPLPPGWDRIQGKWRPSQPVYVDHFQNVITGEYLKSRPPHRHSDVKIGQPQYYNLKMKWFPYSSTSADTEYHLASDDDVRSSLRQWKRKYYVLVALYTLTILLIVAYIPMSNTLATGIVRAEAYFGYIPRELVKFRLDKAFVDAEPGTPANQSVWDMLMPLGSGFVEVQNPFKYGLKGGFPIPNTKVVTEIYSISMFHQLYCLSILKDAFGRDRDPSENQAAEHNLGHCFDYLRQAVMCAGDTTLETALVNEDGDVVPGFDGWGDAHECRSYEAIFDFAEKHRVKDESCLM
ncbi:hypothetical protein V494_07032 [Pseudogymnoascus sp. VKM F-4513 (FW-928)]|nr:hypothetical protein V494_07032 [Pseudogymnoascus sp. VKM F-4513 (FW-928)]